MKKPVKKRGGRWLVGALLLLLTAEIFLGLVFWFQEREGWPRGDVSSLPAFSRSQAKALRTHLNKEHLALVASVASVPDDQAIDVLVAARKLLPLRGLNTRNVSYPYLRPAALKEAQRINSIFKERLQALGIEGGLVISSALRTTSFQSRLRKGNSNASRRSTHTSGMAFDIHYKRFGRSSIANSPALPWRAWWWDIWERRRAPRNAARLKGLLAEILMEEQAAGRILVIYERQQPVFHVTVAP